MLLKELPQEFRTDHLFRYKYDTVEYQCKATYLPFGFKHKRKYEALEMSEIYTPLLHLQWEATNTKESIYKSHWIMPHDVLWWLENRDETAYDEMINYATLNNGHLQ